MKDFVPRIPKILADYGIKPNPPDVRQGIDSILPGLQEMQVGPFFLLSPIGFTFMMRSE